MALTNKDLQAIADTLRPEFKKLLTDELEPLATTLETVAHNTTVNEHLYSLLENRSFELAQRSGQDPDAIDAEYSGWTKEQVERLAAFFERKLKELA